MMVKTFSDAERHIVNIFTVNSSFIYDNTKYTINVVDKPTCSKGEPKTDIYVGATSETSMYHEFKISFKKENADFLENKTNATRAEQLLGPNWSNIISNATMNLYENFHSRPLIYKSKFSRTNPGSITLGWKFEILNKKSGELSSNISLALKQVEDVYSGINLSPDKRHSIVNNRIIKNSGIANFILFEDTSMSINNIQDVIDSLIPITDYVSDNPNVFFACKALNYRTYKDKYDGDRPLAVYVNWFVRNNKLAYEIKFDTPLKQGGNLVSDNLKKALRQLNVTTTDDLNNSNVEDPSIIYE
jgi:hypothetical protein